MKESVVYVLCKFQSKSKLFYFVHLFDEPLIGMKLYSSLTNQVALTMLNFLLTKFGIKPVKVFTNQLA